MSTIRKKPFIETVIERLSNENINLFRGILNAGGNNVDASVNNLPAKGVKAVNFDFLNGQNKSGILIYTDYDTTKTQCVLITYHRFQDVQIFDINLLTHNIDKINEYCDINEIRRILDDTLEKSSDDWVEKMKERMVYDQTNNDIEVGVNFYVDGETKVNKFGAWSGDSRKIDFNPDNDTTSIYGHLRVGSDETPSTFSTNSIDSITEVGGSQVMFAKFNPTGHIDNHWHIVNTKVDDNLIILGGLQVGTLATHDISSIGATATHDDLLNILQAIASSKMIIYSGAVVKPEYYKSYELANTGDVVLILQSAIFDGQGAVTGLEKLVFTKQGDGSLAVVVTSI